MPLLRGRRIERIPPLPPTSRITRVGEFCCVFQCIYYCSSVDDSFLLVWVCGFVGLRFVRLCVCVVFAYICVSLRGCVFVWLCGYV